MLAGGIALPMPTALPPLQILAYELVLPRGADPDRPRVISLSITGCV